MTWHRKNMNDYLVTAVVCWFVFAFANPSTGQDFVSPQLPLGQTVDGQTYGDLNSRVVQNGSIQGGSFQNGSIQTGSFQGLPSQNRAFERRFVDDQGLDDRAIEGRVIEGRVLTGPNGQPGDMTLRFPDSQSSQSQSPEANLIFGPIDLQSGSPAESRPALNYPPQRQPASASSSARKRPVPLREMANREIIRQRYPDGNVHIARHVMQDDQGNWVNDGQWKLFDQQGAMIASGSYRNGAMDGKWSRLHTAGSGGIFDNLPFIEFEGPYASHANFESGKLSGTWIIQDRQGQKIFEMPYKNGRRNGVAVWHLPRGKIYRRMEFKNDVPVGNLVEYDNQGKILRKEIYKDGMKIVNNVSYYRPSGQKRQESIVRRGRLELQGEDDWWEARPAPMIVTGQDVSHGPIRSWYENGQTKMVGNLVQGLRVGQFIWWHQNGTKQLMGQYDRSGNKTGTWRWWHANGIKSIDGSYTDGQPDSTWQWWNDQGELVNEEDFDPNAQPQPDTDLGLSAQSAISIDLTGQDDPRESLTGDDDAADDDSDDPLSEATSSGSSTGDDADSILENDAVLKGDTRQPTPAPVAADSIDTQTLEGIEPESFDDEEIPEPGRQSDLIFEFDDSP